MTANIILLPYWNFRFGNFVSAEAISSSLFGVNANHRFQFQKRRQLFIRAHTIKRPASSRSAATTQIGRPLSPLRFHFEFGRESMLTSNMEKQTPNTS
jgi:hypothetical protein